VILQSLAAFSVLQRKKHQCLCEQDFSEFGITNNEKQLTACAW